MLHTIGAHYTFEQAPAAWLQSLLGSERNHYDRIAHFCVGLNSFMLAELALRKRWAKNAAVSTVGDVLAIMAMAAAWEIGEELIEAKFG